MNCNLIRSNLVAYIHGELDKKIVIAIHRHLSTCETCVLEEIELRKANRLLDQFQFDVLPDDFDEQLHRKIQKIEKAPKTTKSDLRRIVYAVAATILIMIGIQWFGSRIVQSTYQSLHFKDFPTTQAIFKSEDTQSESSLKERFIERYLQSRQGRILGNSVIK